MRLRSLLALGAIAVFLLGGCGGGEADTEADRQNWTFEELRLNLDWNPGPENAGPVLAERLGFFDDVKLGVWANTPIYPERPTKYVAGKLVDAALAQAPQVVLAHEEGLPNVIVGSLLPEATMAMIWPKDSGIGSIADLKGKTIAYPGVGFQKDFLAYILEGAGLTLADVKLDDVHYDLVEALTSGRADAIFGGSANEEGVLLEAQGLNPVVTRATDLGIPDYDELVLVVHPGRYAKGPELFQRLLDGSLAGNEAAAEDPEAAARAIAGEPSAGSTRAGIEATAPLHSETGEVDEAKLQALIDWMYEQGMIERKMPAAELIAGP